MIIKLGRREYNVTSADRILDNGACYILYTQKYYKDWAWHSPTVPKATFNRLLKNGDIRMCKVKYRSPSLPNCPMDLYEFVEREEKYEK